MALIHCPECNRDVSDQEISDHANSCPHCGYPFETTTLSKREQTTKDLKLILIILVPIVLVIVALLLYSLSGIRTQEGTGAISTRHYEYALKAIEYTDQYLDYEISVYEAYTLLQDLQDQAVLPETKSTYFNDSRIENRVLFISGDLHQMYASSTISSLESVDLYDEILEYRNELAEIIGEKKR